METLCSSTTKGTGCAAAVPEEKKKRVGKRELLVKTAIYLPLIHKHHWGTQLEDLQILPILPLSWTLF